jgi:hypothetical protein
MLRIVASILIALSFSACTNSSRAVPAANERAGAANADHAVTNTAAKVDDGTNPSGTGVEKEKPAPGKANVQGKAFFNEGPAAGVQVKLCQTFSQFVSGCGGEIFTTKTDENGEYLIKNVPPGVYEGLTIQVFNTPYYVFATSGIVSAAKYNLEEGKTYFAPDTHLFKSDLKLTSPKAGSKIGASEIEVKWEPYQGAAYYKLSIYANSPEASSSTFDYISRRVDGTSFVLDKPLAAGSYRAEITAFNSNDRKIAETPDDLKFTVSGS